MNDSHLSSAFVEQHVQDMDIVLRWIGHRIHDLSTLYLALHSPTISRLSLLVLSLSLGAFFILIASPIC